MQKTINSKGSLSMDVLKRALGEEGVKELLEKYETGKVKSGTPSGKISAPTEDQIRIAEFCRANLTTMGYKAIGEKFGLSAAAVQHALNRVATSEYMGVIDK